MPGEAHRALQWVGIPAGAPRAMPGNASAWVRTTRDQAPRSRGPASGAINPSRQAGAQQPEELRQTYRDNSPGWTGDEGIHQLRPHPVRAACGELRQIRSGSIPSRGLSGERIILTVRPGQQGSCPQVSMAGNLGKARQHSHYHRRRDRKRGLTAPPRRFPPNC